MGLGITTILACGREPCTPTWTRWEFVPETYAKFYFVVKGEATYENDAGPIRLVPGVYFFPAHQRSRHACPRFMDVHWMHISIDSPVLDLRLARVRAIQPWKLAEWAQWEPVYSQLIRFAKQPDEELELRIQAMIMHGFAEVLQRFPETEDPVMAALRERFDPAVRFMDANCRRNPSLAEIARNAGLSGVHFHRSFTRAFHATPHAYMLRRRMDLAHQLLSTTADPISEIARACGYEDQFYFSRVFKRRFDVSPEKFRSARASSP